MSHMVSPAFEQNYPSSLNQSSQCNFDPSPFSCVKLCLFSKRKNASRLGKHTHLSRAPCGLVGEDTAINKRALYHSCHFILSDQIVPFVSVKILNDPMKGFSLCSAGWLFLAIEMQGSFPPKRQHKGRKNLLECTQSKTIILNVFNSSFSRL